ncbi:UNVERIFIED_CONTAM: hypothetical protein Slati_2377800 [Sesamum latifolium]|uniref:Uncharacterized protein n=1 Tax=Sesamum latifolium TaxID=2727402 RepID=A0AAW2WBW6_9LAMI
MKEDALPVHGSLPLIRGEMEDPRLGAFQLKTLKKDFASNRGVIKFKDYGEASHQTERVGSQLVKGELEEAGNLLIKSMDGKTKTNSKLG